MSFNPYLISSGNVSKTLWASKKDRERGKLLSQYLQLEDIHILASRVFRSHFEHFDERVEETFNHTPTSVYIDRQMNPSIKIFFFDNRKPMCQRAYNTFNHTLIFDGEILDIKEVIISLKDI